MSLAIATASRDDRPSSTIGVESLIASADWPVALAIQLRSHSRISATVMSVRGGRALGTCYGDEFCEAGSVIEPSVCECLCQPCQCQSVSSGKALATFPLRRLPSRYAARQARRPILPLEVRGIAPAGVSSTSRTVTP